MQGGFGGGMMCGWMDVHYRFLIPTSPQYISRVFFVPYAEKPPQGIKIVTSVHINRFLNPGLYGKSFEVVFLRKVQKKLLCTELT
jgi:hypothetical protein